MKYSRSLALAALATLVSSPDLRAQGLMVGGDVELLASPPTSVRRGDLESSTLIRVFQERQNHTLLYAVGVGVTEPGVTPSPGILDIGTEVDVYLFHQDTVGGSQTELTGWVEFPEPVVGIIYESNWLNLTDGLLGSGSTDYPGGGQCGLELNTSNDDVAISANGRRVDFRGLTSVHVDQIRVLTATSSGTNPFVPYCFGHSGCPCGNNVSPNAEVGCANSTGRGARLGWSGTNVAAQDDLSILITDLPARKFGVVFMGPNEEAASPFGDGFRCVDPGPTLNGGGGFWRFPLQSSGDDGYILQPGIVSYANAQFGAGDMIQAGTTWKFQGYYRDPQMQGCTGAGFNLTNALSVTFD